MFELSGGRFRLRGASVPSSEGYDEVDRGDPLRVLALARAGRPVRAVIDGAPRAIRLIAVRARGTQNLSPTEIIFPGIDSRPLSAENPFLSLDAATGRVGESRGRGILSIRSPFPPPQPSLTPPLSRVLYELVDSLRTEA